ncbi:FimD/PapC N-terminal domain-containing protein [Paraburkholderia sp. IMGN_8]|uniref:FimD/PapC N-terminal domain-containing protein n=1 Tax=Paraburkholderia sp. IMGN_8 TaxID=3136564 RepID=UPI003100BE83
MILGALAAWGPTLAFADSTIVADVQFNDQFLMKPRRQSVDVSRFERGNPVQPGEYIADLYVNGNWVGHNALRFVARDGTDSAAPCFYKALIEPPGGSG